MPTKPSKTNPSAPLPQCDCLNDCGDDPRIDRGTARPCQVHINHMRAKHLQNAAADLLAACEELINCIDPDRDREEGKRARAAIAKAQGKTI